MSTGVLKRNNFSCWKIESCDVDATTLHTFGNHRPGSSNEFFLERDAHYNPLWTHYTYKYIYNIGSHSTNYTFYLLNSCWRNNYSLQLNREVKEK